MTTTHAECKNFRPNINSVTLPGACQGHQGQIIADLHDPETGNFIRSAVVADLGFCGSAYAQRHCDQSNAIANATKD